jgi:hypothetical protein
MDRPPPGVALAAAVDPAPLLGAWRSFDPDTRGVVALEVEAAGAGLVVRVTGAWEGGGRPWGAAAAQPFAAAGFAAPGAVAFHARYDFGDVDTLLAAYLNLRLLVVDAFTRYRDGSGRAPVWSRDHLFQA